MTLKEFIEKLQTLPPETKEMKIRDIFYTESLGDKMTISLYKKTALKSIIVSTKLH